MAVLPATALLCVLVVVCALSPISPIVSDAAGQRLHPNAQIAWTKPSGSTTNVIAIDSTIQLQTFDGVGGSFERSGTFLFSLFS